MTTAAETDIERAAVLFHALSDPVRIAALDMLRGGERCVCELQDELDIAQSRLSFHLKVLKEAGLVHDRREGRWSYYTIDSAALDETHDFVIAFLPRNGISSYKQSPKPQARSRPACCR
jgi:ArsR family transcriptional regulator